MVWKYFSQLTNNKSKVKCLKCAQELNFFGPTTGLKYHLEKKHNIKEGDFEFEVKNEVDNQDQYGEPSTKKAKTQPGERSKNLELTYQAVLTMHSTYFCGY